jgi:acylphosphatase
MRSTRKTRFPRPTKAVSKDGLIRRFLVTGKVQGVFFRQSTKLEAKRLSIRGSARNLADGSVEVWAQGSAASLDALHHWLQRGPAHARVDAVHEVQCSAAGATKISAEFEVF